MKRPVAAILPALLFILASTGKPLAAQPIRSNQPADVVLGQADFTSSGTDPVGPFTMNLPTGVAVSPVSGKVFVSELNRSRVLRFSSAAAMLSGASAERVFGQSNFTDTSSNQGGATSASGLDWPRQITVDSLDRLWVADQRNHRVLRFDNASTVAVNGPNAAMVVGQINFTNSAPDTSQSRLRDPVAVFVDVAEGQFWVADGGNHRVLRFVIGGSTAHAVLGQPDYVTGVSGTGPGAMNFPSGLAMDGQGNLWVADGSNNRVLRFASASVASQFGALPAAVLGQSGFSSGAQGGGAAGMRFPMGMLVDGAGRLWVGDGAGTNMRVLWFNNAASLPNGAPASGVLGQAGFDSSVFEVTARSTGSPNGLAMDGEGRLWASDGLYNRVVRFPLALDHPPKIRIAGKRRIVHSRPVRRVRGTATDDWGLDRVEVKLNRAKFRRAPGQAKWRFRARLNPGRNRIIARSVDDAGQVSRRARQIVIRR